jgi:hypothetical protein
LLRGWQPSKLPVTFESPSLLRGRKIPVASQPVTSVAALVLRRTGLLQFALPILLALRLVLALQLPRLPLVFLPLLLASRTLRGRRL